VVGGILLLVDAVFPTGVTLSECAGGYAEKRALARSTP
jgi:hypothetical protein